MSTEPNIVILDIGKFIADVRPLFDEMGATKLFDPLYGMYKSFKESAVRITVIGGGNCGKSRLINHLLGQNLLPVASIPSVAEMTVLSQPDGSSGWSLEGESKIRPMEQFPTYWNGPAASSKPINFHIQNALIENKPFRLAERLLPSSESPDCEKRFRQLIYSSDVVLLVMDAHAALRRDEVRFFQACMLYGIAPIIVLANSLQPFMESAYTISSCAQLSFCKTF